MDTEWLLFYSFSLIFYFILHSVLADLKIKEILMQRWIAKRYYRLGYNFLAIGLLLPIAWLYVQVEAVLLFENAYLTYLGLFITGVGGVLLGLALRQYNLSEFSGMQQLKTSTANSIQELKITGFNSLVRHPLYFSSLLMVWGWYLFYPTDLFLVTALIISFYLYIGTRLEEQKLVLEFGIAYKKYQEDVAMLIPFVF